MSTTTTATDIQSKTVLPTRLKAEQHPEPLALSGALDHFNHDEITPVIGREYPNVNLVDDIINAKNADELIRDLAITSKQPKRQQVAKFS